MKPGNLTERGRVVSAPLANVSSSPYRILAREFGANLVFSEMISAEGLIRDNRKTLGLLHFTPDEHPIAIQLFGRSPDSLSEACKIVEDTGADMVDINLGCPARKIVSKCGGAALLKDVSLTADLLSAAVRAVNIPVSLKFRSGWDSESTNFLEVGKLAEECGISMLTLHPRTRASGYSGRADWSKIADLKAAVSIPVVGNGDIRTPQDAIDMIDQTGCDMVMIGRAAMGAPWIFRRVDSVLRGLADPGEPSLQEKIDTCLRFARLLIDEYGEKRACLKMRKYLAWYSRGWRRISGLRAEMFSVETYDDITALFDRYVNNFLRQTA